MNFKTGDKVKLISNRYEESPLNPVWGGLYGKIIGRIVTSNVGPYVRVLWPTYPISITYRIIDLALVETPRKGHHLTKIFC